MELLDRYLQQVRFWLPKAGRQDIIAESTEDLQSQIEQQEAERGRPLGEAEVEAILERWGHPMRVAGQLHGRRDFLTPACCLRAKPVTQHEGAAPESRRPLRAIC